MPVINTIDELESIRSYLFINDNEIPEIIHQTWKTKDIPSHWKPSHLNWIKYHPKHYYILWTDNMNLELIQRFYPELLSKYLNYPYNIQCVDMVRILYLDRYGGIYSDLDIEPLADISSFLTLEETNKVILLKDIGSFEIWKQTMHEQGGIFSNIMSYIESKGRYTNMLMASRPNLKFWRDVINEMLNPFIPWWANIRHFYIMNTTGPFVIDRIAKQYEIVNPKLLKYFPPKIFQPCGICDEKPCTNINNKEKSYIRLLKGSSWGEFDSRLITTLSCNSDLVIMIVILIIISIIIYFLGNKNLNK